jgi:hypothetical protein
MAFLNFFKTPKHQRYQYRPRYWDPKKEELEERMSRYKDQEGKGDVEAVKSRLSKGFRKGGATDYKISSQMRAREAKRSNRVLFITIIILLIITYFALQVYVPTIEKALE